MTLEEGQLFRQYRLIERLGGGGMGQVFVARDEKLHRMVAIKFMADSVSADAEAILRFEREARAAARIRNQYVVTIHTFDEWEKLPFIVTEFVEGHDLSAEYAGGLVDIAHALRILECIAIGLAAAHRGGVIHRDLKPANVRIRPDGSPVIVDFGLGKVVIATPLDSTEAIVTDSTGSVLGTLPYMSPEQLHGNDLTPATDIFTFGVVAFQLLTRQLPFRGATYGAMITSILHDTMPAFANYRPEAPRQLATLIEECLNKTPAERPSAADLAIRLAELRANIVAESSLPIAIEVVSEKTIIGAGSSAVKVPAVPPPAIKQAVEPPESEPPVVHPPKDKTGRPDDGTPPLAALFLGPRAENAAIWSELFDHIFTDYAHWRKNYFPGDPVVVGRDRRRSPSHERWLDKMTSELDFVLNELKHHFPFHSPRYIGHMLSEQTLPSVLGLFAGVLYNPNNVTDEAAPITVKLELEVGKMVAAMLGYTPNRCWAHLTSGGTVANIEALWVARATQFVPFFVREYCAKRNLAFVVKRSDGVEKQIHELETRELINIRPNEAIFMLRRLARFIHKSTRQPLREVLADINEAFSNSNFNVARRGFSHVVNLVGLKPIILVSAAAHYSVKKTANVLGYGEDAVKLIEVNPRFQVDLDKLKDAIFNMRPDEYIAAVVGIVGTTEEGAVDRIHKLRFLRDQLEKEQRRSFWLHLDAAWGGYIRTLFCDAGVPKFKHGSQLEEICDAYVKALAIEERFPLDPGGEKGQQRLTSIRWAEKDLYASFLAMADADSITVDPHKLGYVPYPAGLIAFRNGLVTELITQHAQYISDAEEGVKGLDEQIPIRAVGPYVLEGSKPGAVALGCWLAHKTIPLTAHGHGKVVRTTLLNTKKLFKYLVNHRHMFDEYHENYGDNGDAQTLFTFVPIFQPETNIICFVVHPMARKHKELIQVDIGLRELNDINLEVYRAASVGADERRSRTATAQPFFLSRTRFDESQYRLRSIEPALRRAGIMTDDYKEHGLFVLRSTVMNPWYFEAEKAGIDYLKEFVGFLHRISYRILTDRLRQTRHGERRPSPEPN